MANRNHKSGGIDETRRRRGAVHAIFTILGTLALLQIAACGGTDSSPASQDNPTAVAPSITAQPQNITVTAGQTASFSVTATGTAPLAYQWRRSGNAIAGATAASYTTAATSAADSGAAFSVVVTNSAGTVTSGNAILTVSAASTSPLSITPATLPGGVVQTVYTATLQASGGKTPYAWTVLSGQLPAGLSCRERRARFPEPRPPRAALHLPSAFTMPPAPRRRWRRAYRSARRPWRGHSGTWSSSSKRTRITRAWSAIRPPCLI